MQAQVVNPQTSSKSSVELMGAGDHAFDDHKNPTFIKSMKFSTPEEQIAYLMECVHVANERAAKQATSFRQDIQELKLSNKSLMDRYYALKQNIISLVNEA